MEEARQGRAVVLIVAETDSSPVERRGPGRVAVLVGDPEDPATWQAAEAMERELFASG